jgi:hypothetical protein
MKKSMLRTLVYVLLAANALYFSWSVGVLSGLGLAPTSGSEPQRIAQQLQPHALQILSLREVAELERPPAPECLRSGPWDKEQLARLRPALENALPPDGWRIETLPAQARWILYMGKYPNQETLKRKLGELANIPGVKAQTPRDPALQPGISLGSFDSESAAQTELGRLNRRGVRTARVVQESEAPSKSRLVLPEATTYTRQRLQPLQSELQAHPLEPC